MRPKRPARAIGADAITAAARPGEAVIVVNAARRVRHWSHAAEAIYGRLAVDAIGEPLDSLVGSADQVPFEALVGVGPAVLYSDRPEPGFPNSYTSPNAMALLGVAPVELTGLRFMARVHPEDRHGVEAGLARLLEQGNLIQTYRFRHGDGGYRWIRDVCQVLRDPGGRPTRIVGYLADVTDQYVLSEDRLRLAAAMDQTTDGVVMIDPSGSITYINASFAAMTGRSPLQLIGESALTLAVGPLRAVYEVAVQTAMRGERWTGVVHAAWRVDRPLDLEAAVWPLMVGGEVANLVCVLRDVTLEHRLDADLRQQSDGRDALVEAMGRLPTAGSLEERAHAIASELAALGRFDVAAVLGFSNGHGVHSIAEAGAGAGQVKAMVEQCGATIRELATAYRRIDRAMHAEWHHETNCPWERAGLSFLDIRPLVADGLTFGAIIAGATDAGGPPAILDVHGLQAEYAALAAALLAPEWAERRRSTDLHEVIEGVIRDNAFRIVMQPTVEIETRTVVGYEALTRFADAVAPDVRFADAGRVGLGLDLEEATLRAAMAGSASLPTGVWLSLNVSPDLIMQQDRLGRILAGRGDRRIVLEVTEHAPVEDYGRLRHAAASFGDGVELAVDDAGARFASLRHIADLRPRFVKLDMSIVRGVTKDPARKAIIAGMVHFAVETNCVLIAEGIERESELRALRRLGVSFGQGFLFGRPISVSREGGPA